MLLPNPLSIFKFCPCSDNGPSNGRALFFKENTLRHVGDSSIMLAQTRAAPAGVWGKWRCGRHIASFLCLLRTRRVSTQESHSATMSAELETAEGVDESEKKSSGASEKENHAR